MNSPLAEEPRALFVGLCTLDLIYSVTHVPGANEKITALRQTVSAGGPATNAAVTFAHLGGQATLLTGVGEHTLAAGIRADLQLADVALVDVAGEAARAPAISTIMVTSGSGERSVVSLNATGQTLQPPTGLDSLVESSQTVLIDGHHSELALAAVQAGHERGRLCILDGGSWKDNTRHLLSYLDAAVCSADFHPPGVSTVHETLDYLLDNGVSWAAVTNGPQPIAWACNDARSEIPVPAVTVVDTLGAGDIFHGAFAYAISKARRIEPADFISALERSAVVAACACQSFGTRTWMKSEPHPLCRVPERIR
jgi:sugar/nucleoside kinase (ribokinase family)